MLALDDPAGARRELSAIPADAPEPNLARRDYLQQTLDRAVAAASPAEAAKQLGLAFVQADMWPLARAALVRALTLDPGDAEAMAFLGHAEAQLGRPAWEHLNRAVVVRPGWPMGHYLLGLYYLQRERPDAAAVQLRVTTRMDPGNAQALLDLSHAYVMQGKYVEAEEALNAAVAAAPRDLRVRMALAQFYTDSSWQAADRGLAAAQSAADLAPQDARARDLLGWMYFLAGDLSQAHLHLISALGLDPDQASTYFHLGKLYAARRLPEQARSAFLRAVDLDTDGGIRERAQQALSEMSRNTTPY
jgi:Flp pilus assembly protein TadD